MSPDVDACASVPEAAATSPARSRAHRPRWSPLRTGPRRAHVPRLKAAPPPRHARSAASQCRPRDIAPPSRTPACTTARPLSAATAPRMKLAPPPGLGRRRTPPPFRTDAALKPSMRRPAPAARAPKRAAAASPPNGPPPPLGAPARAHARALTSYHSPSSPPMATISAALSISFLPSPVHFAVATTSSSRIRRAARFRCCAEPSSPEKETPAPPTLPHVKPPASPWSLWGISTSTWCAGIAGLGFLETGYLSYLKLTGSEAFCPVGGGGCGDVLESDYSVVFGIPLPLVGLVAYGLVTALSVQENGKNLLPGIDDLDIRLTLLLIATSMATASAYFLYILSTKFVGTSCSYCLLSAFLSFTLLFIRLKDFGFEHIQKLVGLQLAVAVIVALALTNSYSSATTQLKGTDDFVLEPYETEITTESTPFAISLARHLHSIGAKMYGAFWCSHCNEQKQMFGREATKILDYVECFPNGAGKGKKMAPKCAAAGVEGFPTWFINGKVLSGDQELPALAEASGFVVEGNEQS